MKSWINWFEGEELDAEPGAGQDILRELGHWLINLADEKAERRRCCGNGSKPKDDHADNDESLDESSIEDQEEDSDSSEEDSDSYQKNILSKQTPNEKNLRRRRRKYPQKWTAKQNRYI